MSDPDATRPLAHVRVLDLTRMIPGAFCTLLLADLGADVLKVEAPGYGDGLRFMTGEPFAPAHVALNRGKRSMTLDLRTPSAPDVLRRIAGGVDVVVESQRPGMLDGLGIGFEDLRRDNPGLVWCSLTGFGPDGPNVDAPGHDMTYLGYSGLLSTLTVDGEPPVPTSTLTLPIAALMGAFGIVSALTHRERTGEGARVDTNMVDSAIWTLGEQLARAANAPSPPWGSSARRANYRCADGRWVTCTASEPKPWAKLVEALGAPDVPDDATAADLAARFATKPQSHWLEHPGMAGGVGPVNEPADLIDDPQVTHRRGMVRIDGGGPLVFANPIRINGVPGDAGSHALTAPPELGEHTDAALSAAGFTADEIAGLRADAVI